MRVTKLSATGEWPVGRRDTIQSARNFLEEICGHVRNDRFGRIYLLPAHINDCSATDAMHRYS